MMNDRKWWLAVPIVIVLAAAAFILMRRGSDDDETLPEKSARSHTTTGTTAKSAKRPHSRIITPLVSPVPGMVKLPALTDEQIERYLSDNHRSAMALLTASRAKDDPTRTRPARRDPG